MKIVPNKPTIMLSAELFGDHIQWCSYYDQYFPLQYDKNVGRWRWPSQVTTIRFYDKAVKLKHK